MCLATLTRLFFGWLLIPSTSLLFLSVQVLALPRLPHALVMRDTPAFLARIAYALAVVPMAAVVTVFVLATEHATVSWLGPETIAV